MSGYTPLGVESAITDAEARWLFETAKEMATIVEIGSYRGKSTHALLSGCKGKVYAVDHFKGSSDRTDATFERSGEKDFLTNVGSFSNLVLLKMESGEAAKAIPDGSVDMVFVDGGHTFEEAIRDFNLWYPKAKKLFCGHDVRMSGVEKALEAFGATYTNVEGSIWAHYKQEVKGDVAKQNQEGDLHTEH